MVDSEAKSAARPHAVEPGRATLTYLKRVAKLRLVQSWKERWRAAAPRGFFAPADRLPPSLHPAAHFSSLGRKLYSRVTQCHTGHAFTGDYYRRFVPTADQSCECGEPLRSRTHILQECHLLADERANLRINCRDPYPPALADLLGTREGIDAPSALHPGHRGLRSNSAHMIMPFFSFSTIRGRATTISQRFTRYFCFIYGLFIVSRGVKKLQQASDR